MFNILGFGKRIFFPFLKNIFYWSYGQDGGIGRDTWLPPTNKRRITTNLKSINNQKCQKIKLHGTLTTKELKKKSTRTTRPVRRQTLQADWGKPWPPVDLGGRAGCWAQWAAREGLTLRGFEVAVGYGWGCHSRRSSWVSHKSLSLLKNA